MKKILLAALALLAIALPEGALAQSVTSLPAYLNPGVQTDLGNGPQDLRIVSGNALLATSLGTGIGSTSGSSTTLTLTATPTTVPCVGCAVSGVFTNPPASAVTIPSTALISAYNGGLLITMSTLVTVPGSTPLAWGSACPASPPTGVMLPVQASVGGDLPFYTTARICGYSPNGPGAAVLSFPIGAH
jgi:hypothetical protein